MLNIHVLTHSLTMLNIHGLTHSLTMLNIHGLTHSHTMLNVRIIKDLTADASLEMEFDFFFKCKKTWSHIF